MYSEYMFWRRKPDEKHMLTALRHQVAQDTNLHFYIFFKFETLQKFSDMTRQYGGTLLWHWDFTDTPFGFLLQKPIVGLVEFDCSDPKSDPAESFAQELAKIGSTPIVEIDNVWWPKERMAFYVHENTPSTICWWGNTTDIEIQEIFSQGQEDFPA